MRNARASCGILICRGAGRLARSVQSNAPGDRGQGIDMKPIFYDEKKPATEVKPVCLRLVDGFLCAVDANGDQVIALIQFCDDCVVSLVYSKESLIAAGYD